MLQSLEAGGADRRERVEPGEAEALQGGDLFHVDVLLENEQWPDFAGYGFSFVNGLTPGLLMVSRHQLDKLSGQL
jgi:hypothetical protein